MPMQAPFKLVEGHSGPTRMEVQKYFSKQEGLLRAKINATEKAFNIHDLKIDSKGQVVSFEQSTAKNESKQPKTFREHLDIVMKETAGVPLHPVDAHE